MINSMFVKEKYKQVENLNRIYMLLHQTYMFEKVSTLGCNLCIQYISVYTYNASSLYIMK